MTLWLLFYKVKGLFCFKFMYNLGEKKSLKTETNSKTGQTIFVQYIFVSVLSVILSVDHLLGLYWCKNKTEKAPKLRIKVGSATNFQEKVAFSHEELTSYELSYISVISCPPLTQQQFTIGKAILVLRRITENYCNSTLNVQSKLYQVGSHQQLRG